MTPPDDILGKTGASESTSPAGGSAKPDKAPPAGAPRTVGPESEDRGGPEAPAESLDNRQP